MLLAAFIHFLSVSLLQENYTFPPEASFTMLPSTSAATPFSVYSASTKSQEKNPKPQQKMLQT